MRVGAFGLGTCGGRWCVPSKRKGRRAENLVRLTSFLLLLVRHLLLVAMHLLLLVSLRKVCLCLDLD